MAFLSLLMAAMKLWMLTVMSMIPCLSRGASSMAMLTLGRGVANTVPPLDVPREELLLCSRGPGGIPDSLALTSGEVGVERFEEWLGDSVVSDTLRGWRGRVKHGEGNISHW